MGTIKLDKTKVYNIHTFRDGVPPLSEIEDKAKFEEMLENNTRCKYLVASYSSEPELKCSLRNLIEKKYLPPIK